MTLALQRLLSAAVTGVPTTQLRDLAFSTLIVAAIVAAATLVPTSRGVRLDLARLLRVD
jgi:hypothetical protein